MKINTLTNKESEELFYELLYAESEQEVSAALTRRGLLNDTTAWSPLGDTENNWSVAGGQQADPAAALAEKLVNSMDAVLIYLPRAIASMRLVPPPWKTSIMVSPGRENVRITSRANSGANRAGYL